jgi:hypothetical protein
MTQDDDTARHQLNQDFKRALRRSDEAPNDLQAFLNLLWIAEVMKDDMQGMEFAERRKNIIVSLIAAVIIGIIALSMILLL